MDEQFDPAEIRKIREERQCSMQAARNILWHRQMTERIEGAQTVEDLRAVLRSMLVAVQFEA